MSIGNDIVLCPLCKGEKGHKECPVCKGEGRTFTWVAEEQGVKLKDVSN